MNTNKNMKNNNEKNDKVDLIRGDPKIAIKAIAWPMIITLVLNMVYNMVDRVWVAGLGSDPLAAIGFVTPLFIIIGGIANGFGAGANSLISRYIGANKKDSADNSALHGVIIGLILSILIPLILLPCLENLLIVMGASSVITYAKPYAAIIILGSFTLIFNGILSSELRAEGDVKRATIALIFTGVLNMIIDPIFIYTLNLEVEGAALATILSATVATCLMLYWMFIKKDTYLSFKIKEFHYNAKITKELIAVALPASVEQLIISVLTIIGNLILSIVATTTIIAGYTAAWSVIQVGMMTSVGIGTAAITVGGVAYGARDYEKLKTTCYYSIKLSMIIAIAIVILIEIFAPQIALLFSYSTSSAHLGVIITETLRILALFLLGIPLGLCSACVFQGMGKGTISLILTVIRELILVLLLTLIFTFVFGLAQYGLYYGLVLGVAIGSIIGFIVFKYYLKRLIKYKE